MTLGRLSLILLLGAGLALLSACGSNDEDLPSPNVAFTPRPTPTPLPKQCGNGVVDPGEECDLPETGMCGGGESCVCCTCLADGEDLGVREFSVARPPSRFLSTGLAGADVSIGLWLPGPIRIAAGRPDPNLLGEEACTAPLEVVEDAILGFSALDQSTFCAKLFAEGSGGVIDCDGGTAHDTMITQNSNGGGEEEPAVLETGLGDPLSAGPGALTLTFTRLVIINAPFSPGRNATICPDLDYDDPLNPDQVAELGLDPSDVLESAVAFTTEMTAGIVTDVIQGGPDIMLSAPGANFTCGTWSQEDAVGTLAGAISGLDTQIGDTVNVFLLTDTPEE